VGSPATHQPITRCSGQDARVRVGHFGHPGRAGASTASLQLLADPLPPLGRVDPPCSSHPL